MLPWQSSNVTIKVIDETWLLCHLGCATKSLPSVSETHPPSPPTPPVSPALPTAISPHLLCSHHQLNVQEQQKNWRWELALLRDKVKG
jgi:hypothetical protein